MTQNNFFYERLSSCFDQERKRIAKLLADKDDSSLLGQTEYELRDRIHTLGATALEVADDERQKRGALEANIGEQASTVRKTCDGDARCVGIRQRLGR